MCLSCEFEVSALVLLRLFPSQYVALPRLTFKALPFGHQKAGDSISASEKNAADLLA
jgi:hypothetical protein